MPTDPNRPSLGDLLDFAGTAQDLAVGVGELANSLPGVSGAYKAFCRVAAGTPGGQLFDALDLGNVCTPYLQPDGRTFGGEGPPPFTGGQCPGVAYRLDGFSTVDGVQFGATGTNRLAIGPIRKDSTPLSNGDSRTRIIDSRDVAVFSISSGAGETDIVITDVRREDGLPDDCGDPPGEYEPGDGYMGEGYGNPQDIEGPDGRTRPTIVFEPTLDADGNLSIPVSIDGLELDIGNPDGAPPDVPQEPSPLLTPGPGIDGGPGSGPTPIPPGPDGSRCVAVSCKVNVSPAFRGRVSGTDGNFRYYEPQGNLSVEVEGADGFTSYQRDVIVNTDATVEAIAVEGLTIVAFRVNVLDGLSYTVTPFYRVETEEAA